jgi:hypothetical protein
MRTRFVFIVFVAFSLLGSRPASADAGVGQSGDGGGSEEASDDAGGSSEQLACDGALCDTTNGAECSVIGRAVGGRQVDSTSLPLLLSAIATGVARRARRGARRPGRGGRAC